MIWKIKEARSYCSLMSYIPWSVPDVLVVHLKRFRQSTRATNKLDTMVEFPIEGFDMGPNMARSGGAEGGTVPAGTDTAGGTGQQSNTSAGLRVLSAFSPWKHPKRFRGGCGAAGEETTYELYSVCNHHGSDLQGGHYTAVCRNPTDGQWYLFDDVNTRQVGEEEVVTNDDTDIELDDEFNEESLLTFEKPPERRRKVTVLENPHHHSGCSTLCAATYQAARQRRRTITNNCHSNMSSMSSMSNMSNMSNMSSMMSTSEDAETSDEVGKVAPVRKSSRFQMKKEEPRKLVEGRWKLIGSRNYEEYLTELGKHLVLT